MSQQDRFASTPSAHATSRRYRLVSAILAFLMWGSWAYWANRGASSGSPWTSALTQGTGSFVITLVMVRAVTWLYHHLPFRGLELFLPALITVLVTGSCLATAHLLAGTPHIVRTIAPALSVAFLFNVYTAHQLSRSPSSTANQES